MTDPFVGRLAFFRVYSGRLNAGSYVLNVRSGKNERISRIMKMFANKQNPIDFIEAGDIGAAVGFKDIKTGDKVDPDTVFQLASLSKSISSTVAAQQVGANAIGWDTPIVSRLPWFALSDPAITKMVTVGDMFSHRSGLPDHAGDEVEDLGYDRRYVLDRLRDQPLDPFRISYAYTNFGLTSGAEAVAVNARKPWEDLADDVLLKPLGMTSTSYRFSDFEARKNRALGHIHIDGKYKTLYVRDPQPQSPAGGVSSSVNDLAKWMTMLLAQDGLLSAASRQTIWQPQVVRQPAESLGGRTGFYGLGWNVDYDSAGRPTVQHSGAFSHGAATNVLLLPGEGLGIVTLTNAYPIGLAEAINRRFLDAVEQGRQTQDWLAVFGKAFAGIVESPDPTDYGKPPATVTPARPAAAYVGTYHSDYWGDLTVTGAGNGLAFTAGPARLSFPLTHYTGDQFFFATQGESATGNSGATFGGPADWADTLTIAAWNVNGLGTFRRTG